MIATLEVDRGQSTPAREEWDTSLTDINPDSAIKPFLLHNLMISNIFTD
jgi:hypothetical protein